MKKTIAVLLVVALFVPNFTMALADRVKLPLRLETIEAYAFYGDQAIGVVEIPYGTVSIDSHAFARSGVTLAIIPNSVTYIHPDAFEDTAVKIRCSEGSYAHAWALENGFELAEGMNQDEAWEELEDLRQDPLTQEDLYSGSSDLISAEGITNEEILADIAEINALIEEGNALAEESNSLAETLMESADSMNQCADTVTQEKTASYVRVTFDATSMVVDRHISDVMDEGVEIGETSTSEDGSITTLSATNGETWYLYEDNGNYRISGSMPSSDAAARGSRDFLGDFAHAARQKLDAITASVSRVGDLLLNNIASRELEINNLRTEISMCNVKAEDYERMSAGMGSAYDDFRETARQYRARSRIAQASLDKLTRTVGNLNKVNAAFIGLNIGGVVNSVMKMINYWNVLREIEEDGHPNAQDSTYEAERVAIQMNCKIGEMKGYLLCGVLTNLASIAVTVGTLVSVIPTAGTSAVPLLLINGIMAVIGTMLGNRMEGTMDTIVQYHAELHTSVYGWVTDERNGNPISGVKLFFPEFAYEYYTDENGYFDMHLLPYYYSVTLTCEGYEEKNEVFGLETGEATEKKIQMKKKGRYVTISGIICAATDLNWGLENVCVSCEGQVTYTDWYGQYSIMCPQGSYITYSKGGYATQTRYVGYDDENWWFDPNIQM